MATLSNGTSTNNLKHAKLREMIMLALCAPIIIAGKIILGPIPNVECVTFFIVLFSVVFGWKTLFPVAIFLLEEGLRYGFGPTWYIFYCIIWPLLSVMTVLLKPVFKTNAIAWAIFASVIFVPIFSGTNILILKLLFSDMFPGGGILAYLISEIPYDIAHIIGNFAIMLALFTPLYRVLEKLMKSGNAPLGD